MEGDFYLGYLTSEVIDVNRLLVDRQNTSVGGTVIFLGTVRELNSENIKLLQLNYEAYETMAEEIFSEIETEAEKEMGGRRDYSPTSDRNFERG